MVATKTRKTSSKRTSSKKVKASTKHLEQSVPMDCWEFPASQGLQCGRLYWTAMVPWAQIVKLVPLEQAKPTGPLDLKGLVQRSINWSRVKKLASYLLQGKDNDFFVLPSLTLTFNSDVDFDESAPSSGIASVGTLKIPKDADFHIADGQHRAAAIARLLEQIRTEDPKAIHDWSDETIPVTFFIDTGDGRKQQIFLDLNQYVCKPNSSLFTLFDHRSPVSDITRQILFQIPFLESHIAHEHTNVPKGDKQKLIPLNALEKSTALLLGDMDVADPESLEIAKFTSASFWKAVSERHPVWRQASEMEPGEALRDLREQSIAFHAITLNALGLVGASLRSMDLPDGEDWLSILTRLERVNWSRSNAELEGLIMMDGKIVKTNQNCRKLADYILSQMLPKA